MDVFCLQQGQGLKALTAYLYFTFTSLPSLENMLPTAFCHMGNRILQWCGGGGGDG